MGIFLVGEGIYHLFFSNNSLCDYLLRRPSYLKTCCCSLKSTNAALFTPRLFINIFFFLASVQVVRVDVSPWVFSALTV